MRAVELVRLACFLMFLACSSTSLLAYQRDSRVPLSGRNQYYNASGNARYVAKINEPHIAKMEELTIDVKNVPLKPGTVLVVYVDNEMMGSMTVDKRQSGNLKVSLGDRKFIPRISAGTFVVIKTIDGVVVLQ